MKFKIEYNGKTEEISALELGELFLDNQQKLYDLDVEKIHLEDGTKLIFNGFVFHSCYAKGGISESELMDLLKIEKLSGGQAILSLENAMARRSKKDILDLIAPDDPEMHPDWDNEPDVLFEKWERLCDKAKNFINL